MENLLRAPANERDMTLARTSSAGRRVMGVHLYVLQHPLEADQAVADGDGLGADEP
jgi:hypothetical protein